jgi:DNA-binding NarL/FixJ family response regulator
MPIRILIADDHPVVRAGLVGIFSGRAEFAVIGEAEQGAQAVALVESLRPDVLLLDLRMPVMSGLEAMRAILARDASARILILTTYDSDQDIEAALNAGAMGYLLKDAPREELYQAVRAAAQGRRALGMTVSARLLERRAQGGDALTEREMAVLALAAQGKINAAIGQALHISEATVKTHLKHIYAKLDVPDRAAAVAAALARGILRMGE